MMTREAFKAAVWEKSRQIEEWDSQTGKRRRARTAAVLLLFFFLFVPALLFSGLSDLPIHSVHHTGNTIFNDKGTTQSNGNIFLYEGNFAQNIAEKGNYVVDAGCSDSTKAFISLLIDKNRSPYFRAVLLPEDAASELMNTIEKESLAREEKNEKP